MSDQEIDFEEGDDYDQNFEIHEEQDDQMEQNTENGNEVNDKLREILTQTDKFNQWQDCLDAQQNLLKKLQRVTKKEGISLLQIINPLGQLLLENPVKNRLIVLNSLIAIQQLTNQWEEIRQTKYLNLITHLYDYLLTKCDPQENGFQQTAIIGLLSVQRLQQLLHPEQYLYGSVFIMNNFVQNLVQKSDKFTTFDDVLDEFDYVKDINSKKQKSLSTQLNIFINLIEPHFHKNQNSQNFGLVYEPLRIKLKLLYDNIEKSCPEDLLNKLEQIILTIESTGLKTSKKSALFIIPDLPIIKVKPLNPRIKDEFLGGYKPKKTEDTQKLQKKSKLIKKSLMREIKSDQKVINEINQEKIKKQKEIGQAAYKNFKRVMDDAQLEYKKLKTQQLNIKRHKKKSHRMAGNKHQ